MLMFVLFNVDVIGLLIYLMVSFDSYLLNVCSDSVIGYFGYFGGVMFGGMYSIGCDVVGLVGLLVMNCVGNVLGDFVVCW